MSRLCTISIVIIISLSFTQAEEIRQLELLFQQLNVSHNPNMVVLMNYSISENKKTFSMKFQLLKVVEQFKSEFKIELESRTNPGVYTTIVNENVNFCKLMKSPWIAPGTYLAYQTMKAYTHGKVDFTCPVQPIIVDVRNMQFDLSKMPPLLPNDNYLATYAYKTIKDELILRNKFHISVNSMGSGKRIRQRNRRI